MSRVSSIISGLPGVIENIELSSIRHNHYQVRSNFDDIAELSASINRNGLFHPIILRTTGQNCFEIVAGNRRFDACKFLGWRKIACHILEIADKDAFEIFLIENIQRKNLQPFEEAYAFKIYVTDFGWGGTTELAAKLNKSVSYVTKRMMLLDLPLDVRNSMEEGSITVSAVEELLCIKDNNKQSELGKLIKDRHLTVKKTRHILKGLDDEEFVSVEDKRSEESKKIQRSIDKSIVTLRLAMNGIATIIEDIEDNWVVYEILMQNRNLLHDQIDMMMKQRKKLIKHQ